MIRKTVPPTGGCSTTGRSTGSPSVRAAGMPLVAHKSVRATPGRLGRCRTLAAGPSLITPFGGEERLAEIVGETQVLLVRFEVVVNLIEELGADITEPGVAHDAAQHEHRPVGEQAARPLRGEAVGPAL